MDCLLELVQEYLLEHGFICEVGIDDEFEYLTITKQRSLISRLIPDIYVGMIYFDNSDPEWVSIYGEAPGDPQLRISLHDPEWLERIMKVLQEELAFHG